MLAGRFFDDFLNMEGGLVREGGGGDRGSGQLVVAAVAAPLAWLARCFERDEFSCEF
jgi:hypothetical protein